MEQSPYISDQMECMELCLGRMQSQPRACGSRLKEGRDGGHYSGESNTGHPAVRMVLMKPSIGTQEPWFSATMTSVGGTTP